LLTQLQECINDLSSTCISPTKFTYQNSGTGLSTASVTTAASFSPFAQYDFDGDGRKDIAYLHG